jgi:hypothetical protein
MSVEEKLYLFLDPSRSKILLAVAAALVTDLQAVLKIDHRLKMGALKIDSLKLDAVKIDAVVEVEVAGCRVQGSLGLNKRHAGQGANLPPGGVNPPPGGVNPPPEGVTPPPGGVNPPPGGVNPPLGGKKSDDFAPSVELEAEASLVLDWVRARLTTPTLQVVLRYSLNVS